MRSRPLQICRMCAYFTRWRYLWFLAAALLAWLLPGLLGNMLWTALLGALALLALYALLRYACKLPDSHRPENALAETVLVDASLIGRGTMLRAAAQPVDVAPELSLRLGSGALLLGTAMTLTAGELLEPDRLAIHRAVQKLNIVPERMRSHQPLLSREDAAGVTCIRVRDGAQERCYYAGSAAEVIALCDGIWEGEPRPMTSHDRLRLADTDRYLAQGQCRITAYATCLAGESPIFLGFAAIGEEIDPRARQDIATLRDMGLTVMLRNGNDPEMDAASLRILLGLNDMHARADIHLSDGSAAQASAVLTLRCTRDASLVEPVRRLRENFAGIERALRRFACMGCLAFLPCLTTGWTALLSMALLLGSVFFLGDRGTSKLPGRNTLILYGSAAFLSLLLLGAAKGTALGCGLLVILASLGAALRLCDVRTLPALAQNQRPLLYLLGVAGVCLLVSLAVGIVQSVTFLPMLFGVLMGAVLCGLLVFSH